MILFDVLEIVIRIFFGLCCVGFGLGMALWDKHPIFKKIASGICFFVVMYGLTHMLIDVILGF